MTTDLLASDGSTALSTALSTMLSAAQSAAASAIVPALGDALMHFLWQGLAIGAATWLSLRMLRRARPQARYAVACLALIVCLCLPLVAVTSALRTAQNIDATSIATAQASSESARTADEGARATRTAATALAPALDNARPWIVALWAFGAGLMSLRIAMGLAWVRRLRRGSGDFRDQEWSRRAQELARRMGLRRTVELRIVADAAAATVPLAIGALRPLVLLPAALVARMPAELLEALIAHELAHVRRHDYLVNLLQRAVEALLFYHPVVWWLSRRIRSERELIADDLAARAIGDPRRLAVALAELDRFVHVLGDREERFAAPQRLAQAAHGSQLMPRIRALLRPELPARGTSLALPLIGLTALAIACVAYAQSERPAKPAGIAQAASPAQQKSGIAGVSRVDDADIVDLPQLEDSVDDLDLPAIVDDADEEGIPALDALESLATEPLRVVAYRDRDEAHRGYALVGADDNIAISGVGDDIDAIRAAQRRYDGAFLWFRHDGKAYVVRDPALLARAQRPWAATRANEAQMRALAAQMEEQARRMQAVSQELSAKYAQQATARSSEMRKASAEIQALAAEHAASAQAQAELARRNAQVGGRFDEAAFERDMAEFEAQMTRHERELEALEAKLEADATAMEAGLAPLERELEARLERESAPLEALGERMETLGEAQERIMAEADREIERVIEDALRDGRAEPAPQATKRQ